MKCALICLLICAPFFTAKAIVEVKGENILTASDVSVSAVTMNKKALVVLFLSAKCPCSNSHIQEIISLYKDFPQFSFVGVHSNSDESAELSKTYFIKSEIPFPVIQDVKFAYADHFHALKTPHAFVVNSDGKILYQGGVSSSRNIDNAENKFLRDALNDLQINQSVKTPEGRTLGCSIQRGEKNVW